MIRSILILSLLLNILLADVTYYREFNLAKGSIEINKDKMIVIIGEKRINLEKPSDYNIDSVLQEIGISKENLVLIGDYNFDGYSDIGIVTGGGYGGLNVFADYYLYDPTKNSYKRYLKDVSNLEIDKNAHKLISYTKIGARFIEREYEFDKTNRPYISWDREILSENVYRIREYNSKGKKIKSYYEPTNLTVLTDKAYFYKEPKEDKKTKIYITKGEKVKILEVNEQYSWVKIKYKGKKKNYIRWMLSETLSE